MSEIMKCPGCREEAQHISLPNTTTIQCKACGHYHDRFEEHDLDNDLVIDSAYELLSSLEEVTEQLSNFICGNEPDSPELARAKALIKKITGE